MSSPVQSTLYSVFGAAKPAANPTAYGQVPAAASPQTTQAASIGGNLQNLSQLYSLATGVGAASGAGGAADLNAALPGSTAAQGTALGVANADLAGTLSPSSIANMAQTAAERGVATGDIGSPNATASLLAATGNSTEALQQTGLTDLNALTAAAPVGPAFNPNSMLVTPAEQLQQQDYANQLAAAPDPTLAANANLRALGGGGGGVAKGPNLPSMTPGGGTGGIIPQPTSFGATADAGAGGGYAGLDYANMQDNGDGTVYDPSSGITYDAATGAVLDGGDYNGTATDNSNAQGVDWNAPVDDTADYSYADA